MRSTGEPMCSPDNQSESTCSPDNQSEPMCSPDNQSDKKLWQRNYYECIIRNDGSYQRITE